MFSGGFAFFELGSFSHFCVFKKGRLAMEAQRSVMRVHRSKDDDEWAVMSHGFLRYLKWFKLL